ncbi:MAG: twin-arginine translocase subunit TatC [Thiotrichaceae bacterium]
MTTKSPDTDTSTPKSSEMGFLAHLIELRDRLLRLAMAIGIVFVILFPFAQDLYQFLAAPVLAQGQGMIATGPIAPVFIPYKVALLTAFLVVLPYVFYQLWSFVAPGLYKHEKRLIVPLLSSSVALFYLGIAFAYYLLLPMVFKVVQAMTPEGVMAVPDISSYLDFVMMIFIAFGFGFEMPIATILLITTGMTTAEKLGKKRPYVVVGAFVVGMLLTPPDIISQVMLAIPMWLLFEIGLFASRFFTKEIKTDSETKEKQEQSDRSLATAEVSTVTTATTSPTADRSSSVDPAPFEGTKLWEDDDYLYEEDDSVNLDGSDDDDFNDKDYDSSDYVDTANYVPMTDKEMDAELDRIEAEEAIEDELDKENDNDDKGAL